MLRVGHLLTRFSRCVFIFSSVVSSAKSRHNKGTRTNMTDGGNEGRQIEGSHARKECRTSREVRKEGRKERETRAEASRERTARGGREAGREGGKDRRREHGREGKTQGRNAGNIEREGRGREEARREGYAKRRKGTHKGPIRRNKRNMYAAAKGRLRGK